MSHSEVEINTELNKLATKSDLDKDVITSFF
jgi:hypothetical protein